MEKVYVYTCRGEIRSAAEATEGAEGKCFFRAAFGAGGANGASGERDGRERGERKKEKCNFIYARNDPYK